MRIFFSLTAAVLSAMLTAGVQAYSVRGRVADSAGNPLYGASCRVSVLPDSVYYTASVSDAEGMFETAVPDSAGWYMDVSYIGYESVRVAPSLFGVPGACSDSVPVIRLPEQATGLREVVVRGRRPQLTQKDGVLHYNVSDILRTQVVASVHDVLRHIPLLTTGDGNMLSLSGAPLGSVIYINGNRSQMSQAQLMEYLKSVPSEQIKDVEIIYNPSPEWQTQSAVINVVLKKIAAWTFNGMANARASVAHTSTGSGSAAFFGGLPKLSFNATYSFSAGRTASKETSLGRHTVEKTVYEITDTAFSRGRSPRHNIYASLDYGMNGENSLEFSYYGLFSPSGHTHGLSSGRPWGAYSSETHYRSAYNSVRAMYRNRRGIRGGIYYTHYNTRSDEVIYNGGAPVLSQVLDSRATQKVNALNAYADLTTACPHGWTLLYGLSASLTRNTNSQISVSESETMPGSSTSSHIDERSCRLYAGTRRYFFGNRLFAGISLTGELYRMEDYRTFRLLPRASVMYRPSGSHILQGSYSSYRTYPSYWQLQDYISYSTPYELSMGNPSLRPEHWQVGSLVYVLDSRYTLSAVYFRAGDYIFVQKFQSSDALINITQPCNIDFMSSTQLSLSVPLRAGNFFTSNLTATWAWYRFKASDWHGTAFDRKKPAASVNAQNNFILSQNPRISVSLTAMYATGAVDGLFDRSHYWLLNAGAAASFLNGSLTVELGAYDILERESYMSRIRTAGQWLDIKDGYYSRRFSVDISYKFRGYREKDKGDTDASRLGIE